MKIFKKFLALPLIRQLYVGVIATTLFSIALSGCLVGLFYWSSFKLQVQESQNLRIHATTQDIDNWMNELMGSLRYYATLFNNTDMSYDEQVSMGEALLKNNRAIYNIAVFKSDSTKTYELFQHQSKVESIPIDKESYNLAISRKEEFISLAFKYDGQSMLSITLPAIDKNNNVIGVIRAIISLRYMQNLFAVIPHEKFGYSYIIDETNRILANNFDDLLLKKQLKVPYDYFYIMTHKMFKLYRGIDDNLVLGSKNAIPTTQWYMVIEYPVALILSRLGLNLFLMFIAFIASVVVGLLGAFIVYKNISEPLIELTNASDEISSGNFKISLDTNSPHELGQVAKAFNTMSNRLNILFEDLEYQLENKELVSNLALTFIHSDHTTLRQNIDRNFNDTGKFTKANLIWIYYSEQGGTVFANRLQWFSDDEYKTIPEQCKKISIESYPWLAHQLKNLKPFMVNKSMHNAMISEFINDADEVPEWSKIKVIDSGECINCKSMNLQSQICLPLMDDKTVIGFVMLGFKADRLFSESDIQMYSTITNVIGTGILKARNSRLLAEEKERLSITLKSIGDAVISTNTDGAILIMNAVAEQLTGWKANDAIGLPLMKVLNIYKTDTAKAAKDPVLNVMEKKSICNYKHNLTLKSDNSVEYAIELSAAPIKTIDNIIVGTVLVFRDITSKLKTEREYFNIQKLEAVSYLSAGLAHDFNNLLFVISGNISLALEDLPDKSKVGKYLQSAQEAALKGNDITTQLLTFAKQGVLVSGTTDIITRIKHIVELFVGKARSKVTYNIEKNLPLINMPESMVHQIITNIVINAMQSIKDKYGDLTVKVHLIEVSEDDCLPLENNKYISLHIIDNGEGISQENLPKLFLPYYTTKETGTGLGLPTVFSLLTRYNGYIRINSQVGVGTDVEIFFPIVEPSEESSAAESV